LRYHNKSPIKDKKTLTSILSGFTLIAIADINIGLSL
jgi:hypothetical protein